MTPDICYSLICTIYTTFQKTCPSRQSPVFANIFDRLKDVPDEHARGIRERIEELDTMPQNLGKAILGAWETYKMEHGVRKERGYCPTCQNDGGWQTVRQDKDGKVVVAFAPCPSCSQSVLPEVRLLNRRELEASGALVVPPHYPGGWRKFLADKHITAGFSPDYLSRMPAEIRESCRRIADRAGYDHGFDDTQPPAPAPAQAPRTRFEDSPF